MRNSRVLFAVLLGVALIAGGGVAQQQNSIFAALNLNDSPNSVIGQGPLVTPVFTDSLIAINIKGFPGTPVVILNGSLSVNAGNILSLYGFSVDIAPAGPGGTWGPNVLVSGYENPGTESWTSPTTGEMTVNMSVPACSTQPNGQLVCNLPVTFNATLQGITSDPTNMPWGVRSTAAATASFTNGYQQFALSGDNFAIFNFLGGFTFRYYGNLYTRAWISSNGYISFTQASTGFPNPTVGDVRSGTPRIMSFYNDLEPQITATNPRVYAQQFVENNVRKIKFVHERLAEFGNATGGHGGEIVIEEPGDIKVLVAPYNAQPSINTAVGITPGMNIDSGNPPAPGQTAYGRDLSVDATNPANTPPGTLLGVNRAGFELFDTGNSNPQNPVDLIGFNIANGGINYHPMPPGGNNNQYFVSIQ